MPHRKLVLIACGKQSSAINDFRKCSTDLKFFGDESESQLHQTGRRVRSKIVPALFDFPGHLPLRWRFDGARVSTERAARKSASQRDGGFVIAIGDDAK